MSRPEGADSVLVRRYRDGEQAAATALYLRYAHRVRALAARHCTPDYAGRFDPDDVVQSVFRKFFQGVRRQAYQVPPGGEVWGLLMVMVRNKVRKLVEHHRAGKRDVRQTAAVDHGGEAAGKDVTGDVFLRLVLDEQMAGLPDSNREIVRLRLEGHEVAEIAARTGRSRRTVERVLQNFRDRLTRS